MASVKEQEAIRKLMVFLQEWDSGHKVARSHVLDSFIKSNNGKTEPELELEFSQGASLFLARLTAWLRMTYMHSTCLDKLLKSIGIFLSAAGGRRYLIEFLEIGGVMTLLEILGLNHLKEEDKRESVKLLQLIANAGRKYKELICESYGVRCLAELLATSTSAEAQEDAQVLLDSLGRGNPKYQHQVYKGLIAVLPCASPRAQQLALQTLGAMQELVGEAPPGLLEPLLALLGSAHLEVQHEGRTRPGEAQRGRFPRARLISMRLICIPVVRRAAPRAPAMLRSPPLLPRAGNGAGSGAVGILAKESVEVAEELIQLNVVHGLMVAVANMEHMPSQRHGSISLKYFAHTFPFVEEHMKNAVGDALFQLFMDSPETWYTKMDRAQAEELASSILDIPKDMGRKQSTEGM
ncbi:ARMD1 protein, partial [Asarcornis scutulata]|nr:ARMD1 protein [Asarcornis scutulata]